jgi:hypothetical protein
LNEQFTVTVNENFEFLMLSAIIKQLEPRDQRSLF